MARTNKVGYNWQNIRKLSYVYSRNNTGKAKVHVWKTTPKNCSFCTSKQLNYARNKEVRKRVDDINDRHTDRTYVPYSKLQQRVNTQNRHRKIHKGICPYGKQTSTAPTKEIDTKSYTKKGYVDCILFCPPLNICLVCCRLVGTHFPWRLSPHKLVSEKLFLWRMKFSKVMVGNFRGLYNIYKHN